MVGWLVCLSDVENYVPTSLTVPDRLKDRERDLTKASLPASMTVVECEASDTSRKNDVSEREMRQISLCVQSLWGGFLQI